MKIKKNDTVLVVAGRDRGKKGKVRLVDHKHDRVVVEGANMAKKHTRAAGRTRQAGIIERENPLHASDVMLLCGRCNKPARVGYRILEDGKKVRVCRACNEVID